MDKPGEPAKPNAGISRRKFLQGASAAAAGASALLNFSQQGKADESPPKTPVRPGLRRYDATGQQITLMVNGQASSIHVTPQTTLLEALREKLALTGAKESCDRGACGACTVLVDGKAVTSCMMLAIDAVDRPITTIEGLATDDKLDAVQQAFADHDACQCGYCIPGFVLSARAMLDKTPHPDREQIKQGLCGNICRCAAYVKIFDAVEAVGKGGR